MMVDNTQQLFTTKETLEIIDDDFHQKPVLTNTEEIIEVNSDFNLEEFQVVRREFFAHTHEPAVSFNNRKFYVNSACLNKFPNTEYVQALVNPNTKIMALRPCKDSDRGAFQWCYLSKGKRKPRQTTCTLFFLKMFELMNWDPDSRYKMLGNIIHSNGEYLIAFDLTSTEVYQRTFDIETNANTSSKKPIYPIEWQNQFGMTFNQHKQSMLVNVFEGYAIYSIKEKKTNANSAEGSDMANKDTLSEGDNISERKEYSGNLIG